MSELILVPGDENELSELIRNAIGTGTYEQVRVMTPQFERPCGSMVYYYPKTKEEFDNLKKLPDDLLFDFGLRKWDEENGLVLWLYPGEWYNNIPNGYEMVDIFFEPEIFKKGASDDIRHGCLSYGFTRGVIIEKQQKHDSPNG